MPNRSTSNAVAVAVALVLIVTKTCFLYQSYSRLKIRCCLMQRSTQHILSPSTNKIKRDLLSFLWLQNSWVWNKWMASLMKNHFKEFLFWHLIFKVLFVFKSNYWHNWLFLSNKNDLIQIHKKTLTSWHISNCFIFK